MVEVVVGGDAWEWVVGGPGWVSQHVQLVFGASGQVVVTPHATHEGLALEVVVAAAGRHGTAVSRLREGGVPR